MKAELRLLIVEDREDDAELVLRTLRRGGYEPAFRRVETEEAMRAALHETWDVVISDWSMPHFSAMTAFSMLREMGLDLPFLIVSGTVDDESAVKAMKVGVHDFMSKGQLARLIPAIERELREAANRRAARLMNEQLLIAERMASVGTLAASVAHEINNPLAVLMASLDFAVEQLGASARELPALQLADISGSLRDAQEAAERVRRITRDLRVFSHAGDDERIEAVDIHGVLESSIRMASTEIRHRARLVTDYGEVAKVAGNESRLGQVFLNLIVNAAQAIKEGKAEANEIRVVTRMADGGSVMVAIHDTGAGIAPGILPRIFDLFFTSKPVGVGTGLGLAICHRIITGLGGDISVESELGKGSVFRTMLPQAPASAAENKPVAAQAKGGRRGRLLVVDDEPVLCSIIQRMLRNEHDVTAVTSAKEALRLIVGGERFDVVLCDLMMPEMTGMDLHAELLVAAPEQTSRLVFMTGGTFTQNAVAFLENVPNASLEKPFTSATVRGLVRNLLQ